MEPIALIGILFIVLVVIALLYRSYREKRRIEQARALVDLQDALRRMESATSALPDVYLDKPTKVFIYKRMLQIIRGINSTDASAGAQLANLEDTYTGKLEAARNSKDDALKRLAQWAQIPNQDAAHEMRRLVKFLHQEVVNATKAGLIPKAHASRVIKNLKIMASRIPLDATYALGRGALKTKKYRPALSKFKIAQGIIKRSPVRKYLAKQNEQLEELIKKTEEKLQIIAEENRAKSGNSLADGMDKMAKDEQWEQKKNYFED